jgi:hypothetical protein
MNKGNMVGNEIAFVVTEMEQDFNAPKVSGWAIAGLCVLCLVACFDGIVTAAASA